MIEARDRYLPGGSLDDKLGRLREIAAERGWELDTGSLSTSTRSGYKFTRRSAIVNVWYGKARLTEVEVVVLAGDNQRDERRRLGCWRFAVEALDELGVDEDELHAFAMRTTGPTVESLRTGPSLRNLGPAELAPRFHEQPVTRESVLGGLEVKRRGLERLIRSRRHRPYDPVGPLRTAASQLEGALELARLILGGTFLPEADEIRVMRTIQKARAAK